MLANGYANSTSCLKTIEALVFSYVNAIQLMQVASGTKFRIPDGLFTEKQSDIIKLAANDLEV